MRRARGERLVTVLFTDIVRSTEIAAEVGDRRWKALVERHQAIVRGALRRHGGREMDTAGDGFFATFNAQAAAVRCACEAVRDVRSVGIEIRAGLDVGEAEVIGGKIGGVAVNTAARIMSIGGAGDVLVSSVLHDLVPGAGFGFEDGGTHVLKGLEGERRVWRVTDVDGFPVGPPLSEEDARALRERVPTASSRSRRRVTAIVAAAGLATAIAVIGIVAAVRDTQSPSPDRRAKVAPLEPLTLARIDPSNGDIVDRLELANPPYDIEWADERLWLLTEDATVEMIEPTADRAVEENFGSGTCSIAAAAGGGIWIADCERDVLMRIDTNMAIVDELDLPALPGDMGVTDLGDTMWLMTVDERRGDRIHEVDPTTGVVTETIELPDSQLDAFDFVAAISSLWTYNLDTGDVLRIRTDPVEIEVVDSVSAPDQVVSADGSVWVADSGPGETIRYDTPTGGILDRIPAYGTMITDGEQLLIVDGVELLRVDVDDNTVASIGEIPLTTDASAAGPHPMLLADGSLWIAVRG